jgi:hypothetical protein
VARCVQSVLAMKLKYLSVGVLVAGSAITAGAQTTPKAGDTIVKEPLTLTGCVAEGTKANTYLLSNVKRTDAPATIVSETAVYWLSSPDKLKGHTGHQVEIEGTLDDDVDDSSVKTDDGKVELAANEDSKKVEVVENTVAGDAMKAVGTAGTVVSYKVKVKSVTMVSAVCPPGL